MFDKLIYIPHYDSKHYLILLKRLYIQPNEPTNKNFIKVPKVVKPTNKKMLLENFGD